MSPHHIERHLKQHFGVYAGPRKCLRTSQISGWVTSEVDRRKKACIKAALKAVSTGVVEAKKVAKKAANGCEKDGYSDGCVTEIGVVNKETAGLGYLENLKRKWRNGRAITTAVDGAVVTEVVESNGGLCHLENLKRKWRKKRASTGAIDGAALTEVVKSLQEELASLGCNRLVSEVINKRGRKRSRIEYECRWVSSGADETSWECAQTLNSVEARNAVCMYEEKLQQKKDQSVASILCAGFKKPIRTRCCNTVVEVSTYNEAQEVCFEIEACLARRKLGVKDPQRARKAPSRYE